MNLCVFLVASFCGFAVSKPLSIDLFIESEREALKTHQDQSLVFSKFRPSLDFVHLSLCTFMVCVHTRFGVICD